MDKNDLYNNPNILNQLREIENKAKSLGIPYGRTFHNDLSRFYSNDSVVMFMEFGDPIARNCIVQVIVNFFTRQVYQIDLYRKDPDPAFHYRWYDPEYKKDAQTMVHGCSRTTGIHVFDSIVWMMQRIDMLSKNHVNNKELKEQTETVSLDLSDSELALIARAAHEQDITINEFINKALISALDTMDPDWRESCKTGLHRDGSVL